jgi:SAM-dependent methyltransferase
MAERVFSRDIFMKKKKDPGLLYVQELGIQTYRTWNRLYDDIEKKYGSVTGQQLVEQLATVQMTSNSDYTNVDQIFGNDAALVNLWQGQADADIVRKSCNWLSEHADLFGDRLLEVGCGYGYISCFLGRLFPHGQIVSIDHNENHLAIAKQNAARMNISNVTFAKADVFDYEGSFDTILSSRVAHEIITDPEFQDEFSYDVNLFGKISALNKDLSPYVQKLSTLLDSTGNLIFMERFYRDPRLLALLYALRENKMIIRPDTYRELHCEAIENKSSIQAFVVQPEDTMADGDPTGNLSAATEFYEKICLEDVAKTQKEYKQAEAYNTFWLHKKDFLYGASLCAKGRKCLYCLCTLDHRPGEIFSYQQAADRALLQYQTHIQNLEPAIAEVREFIRNTFSDYKELSSLEEYDAARGTSTAFP